MTEAIRLKKRRDFVAASRSGASAPQPGLVLQIRRRDPGEVSVGDAGPTKRVGFTASKKVGGAVIRNRAKRRLRALSDELLCKHGAPGVDYVLIARAATPDRAYPDLRQDLIRAMKRLKVWCEKAGHRAAGASQPVAGP
ncbi:MAG: ribonuclease P protein component [Alphaproteobacteria bacterium]|nr:ribonuclease P protein component [Alphaproteobacteria bacterium]